MKHLGIEVSVKHVPELDPGFLPLGKFNAAFLKDDDSSQMHNRRGWVMLGCCFPANFTSFDLCLLKCK